MRRWLPLLALLLLAPAPALAGGLGVYDTTGFHFGGALRDGGGLGKAMNQGVGLEVNLGSSTSRVHGRLKVWYQATLDLDVVGQTDEDGNALTGGVTHSGLFGGGATIQLLPDLDQKFGVYLFTDVAVAPLVQHIRFYVQAQVGPAVRYKVNDVVQLFAEVGGLFRFEKSLAAGPVLQFGARFTLD